MLSIREIKSRLPNEFIEDIEKMFTPTTVDKILVGIRSKRYTTLRVNTLKYNIRELLGYFKEKNIKFERILWYEDGLIIKNIDEKEIQKLDIFEKGYIYMQSLSSMIPAIVLNPKQNEKILDLTAAPGSKTTQIASMMKNKGYILANELDVIRYEKLKYNIDIQGATIVETINERGERLGEKYKEEFDKVLLDAPCSGEGRFSINDVQTYRSWSTKKVNDLAKLQKKLLKSSYDALKPEGILVYSTCTLNQKENENILRWGIDNLNLRLENIELEIKGLISAFDKNLDGAIRILPTEYMEGFFIAKLKKKERLSSFF